MIVDSIDFQHLMEIVDLEMNNDQSSSQFPCSRLCALLRAQMVKSICAIRDSYYREVNINLSEVIEYEFRNDVVKTYVEASRSGVNGATATATATVAVVVDGVKKTTSTGGGERRQSIDSKRARDEDRDDDQQQQNDAVSPQGRKSSSCDRFNADELEILETSAINDDDTAMFANGGNAADYFQLLPNAPKQHMFYSTPVQPTNRQQYCKAVQREHRMLRSSLPPGVWVKVYEDRMDLISVMMEGPKNTPYEDGLFFFDLQLANDYPKYPPLCHYISYCSDRLNPNLYEDGKVCVSLLGTWTGRDSEVWGPKSTLLQVLVSIQGLILVPEPYFNEAGFEKQKDTQQGNENSRLYNEMVIIKLVQSMCKILQSPPEIFQQEMKGHFHRNGTRMYDRLKLMIEQQPQPQQQSQEQQQPSIMSNGGSIIDMNIEVNKMPDYPLLPPSRGFCLTIGGLLEQLHSKLATISSTT